MLKAIFHFLKMNFSSLCERHLQEAFSSPVTVQVEFENFAKERFLEFAVRKVREDLSLESIEQRYLFGIIHSQLPNLQKKIYENVII